MVLEMKHTRYRESSKYRLNDMCITISCVDPVFYKKITQHIDFLFLFGII